MAAAWPGAAPACAPRPWATSGPLIQHSGEAWFYAIFTLCWLVALFLLDRAVTTGSFWALLAGAAVVGLTFLAHEFVIALLPGLGLALLSWRGGLPPPPRPTRAAGHRRAAGRARPGHADRLLTHAPRRYGWRHAE
jgi:hypothetical protein